MKVLRFRHAHPRRQLFMPLCVCVCVRAAAMEAIRFSAGKRERVEEEKQRECVKYGRNVNCVYLHTLLLLCSIMQT